MGLTPLIARPPKSQNQMNSVTPSEEYGKAQRSYVTMRLHPARHWGILKSAGEEGKDPGTLGAAVGEIRYPTRYHTSNDGRQAEAFRYPATLSLRTGKFS